MKRLFIVLTCLLALLYCSYDSALSSEAATTYHAVVNGTISRNHCEVLSKGYYVLTAYCGLYADDIVGDAKAYYCDPYQEEDLWLSGTSFNNHISVDAQAWDDVCNMMEEVNSYYANEYGSYDFPLEGFLFVRVDSLAILYPQNNNDSDLFNVFFYGTPAPQTEAGISGSKTHIVDVLQPLSLETIKARYTATDKVDGDITDRLVFETNYDPATTTVGSYYLLITVADHAGNTTSTADFIIVKDFEGPVVHLSQDVKVVEVGTVFTSEDAQKLFTYSDNYTKPEKIKVHFDDNYNSAYNTLGQYRIWSNAIDEDGNVSQSKTLTIHVVDTQAPTVTLAGGGGKIISSTFLDDDEIRALLTVSDNYYSISNSEIQILSNTCDGSQGQDFVITVGVTDPSGNYFEGEFLYYITDSEAPIILVKDTLYIQKDVVLTNQQIIEMMRDLGIIGTTSVVSLSSNYFEQSLPTENIYSISYQEIKEDGSIKEGSIQLEYFEPVPPSASQKSTEKNNWWVALLCMPLILIVGYFLLRKKHYEKK